MPNFIKLNDTVRFGITTVNTSNGQTATADATPAWFAYKNDADTIVTSGLFNLRTGYIGTYRANFVANAANGFASNDFVEIHASALVNSIYGRALVRSFVIDDVVDANVVEVSGIPVAMADDVYYAAIKFIRDSNNIQDEYTVQWYKNSLVLASGQVTNGTLSVYNTNNSNALFTNKAVAYFSINHGGMRYNESTPANMAVSGEPYIAYANGTINAATRTWANVIGLDVL